jgi:hypothetical protein
MRVIAIAKTRAREDPVFRSSTIVSTLHAHLVFLNLCCSRVYLHKGTQPTVRQCERPGSFAGKLLHLRHGDY